MPAATIQSAICVITILNTFHILSEVSAAKATTHGCANAATDRSGTGRDAPCLGARWLHLGDRNEIEDRSPTTADGSTIAQ